MALLGKPYPGEPHKICEGSMQPAIRHPAVSTPGRCKECGQSVDLHSGGMAWKHHRIDIVRVMELYLETGGVIDE